MSLTHILLVPIAVARVVAAAFFLLCENGDYLVQEDGGKLIIQD